MDRFVLYLQQTVNGFAWAFMTAWLVWVLTLKDDKGGGSDAGLGD